MEMFIPKPIPSEKLHKDNEKMNKKVPNGFPSKTFLTLIIGGSGSGKSSCLYSLLKDIYLPIKYFDIIYIFNKMTDSNDTWMTLQGERKRNGNYKPPVVEVFNHYNEEEVSEIWNDITQVQQKRREEGKRVLNILFVFDDMVEDGMVKRSGRANTFNNILINRRHNNVSVIFTTQGYMRANKTIRKDNTTHLVVCGCEGMDLENMAYEHGGKSVSKDMIEGWLNECKREHGKGGFLVIDKTQPVHNRYRMNFNGKSFLEKNKRKKIEVID